MVGRWGLRLGNERGSLRDVPTPALIAGHAPVELESMGLALKRAIALRSVAGDVAARRCDLIYLKLVGRLGRLGRRATVEEVEEFFAPYAPFRGLAGSWLVVPGISSSRFGSS